MTTAPSRTRPTPHCRRRRRPVVGVAAAAVGVLAVLVPAAGREGPDTAGPARLNPAATRLPAAAPGDGPSLFPTSPPPPQPPPVFPFPTGGPPVGPPAGPSGFPVPTSPPFIGPTIPTAIPSATPTTPPVPSGPVVVDPGDPAAPAPDPAVTDDPGVGGVEKKPGRFDIAGQIRYAINNWFRNLVIAAWNPILDLLGHTLLATPDVTRSGRVASIWSMNAGIANTVFVLFVIAGGAVVMSHDTLQTRHTLKEIAPRLVIGFVVANASLSVIHEGVGFANAISAAFLGQGLSGDATADALRRMLLDPLNGAGIFLILIGLVSVVMAVVLLLTYVLRVAVFTLLVACAPLALCTHASPYTDALARLWWRAVLGCFAVQVAQSLTLIVALRVFFNNGATTLGLSAGGTLVNFLIACCLLYILIRIPVWTARVVFSAGRRSTLVGIAKYTVLHHTLDGLRHAPGASPARQPAAGGAGRVGGRGRGGVTAARPPTPARGSGRPASPRRPRTAPAGGARPVGVAGPVRFLQPIPQVPTHDLATGRATGPPPPLRFRAPTGPATTAATVPPRARPAGPPPAARFTEPAPPGPAVRPTAAPRPAAAAPRPVFRPATPVPATASTPVPPAGPPAAPVFRPPVAETTAGTRRARSHTPAPVLFHPPTPPPATTNPPSATTPPPAPAPARPPAPPRSRGRNP